MMKKILPISLAMVLGVFALIKLNSDEEGLAHLPSIDGRYEYLYERLVDPRTGEIPANMRMRELEFASRLPRAGVLRSDSVAIDFESIGPYNVGGRTRAFAIDATDGDTYFAGGVSGGVWKSTDAGQSWTRVTRSADHPATSCIIQDTRNGHEQTWYYGSGETVGNSASKSFSAMYRGSGVWKSTNGGETWDHLSNTASLTQKASDWEVVHNMAIDPSRSDSAIVYAATKKGIMRSSDGGLTWDRTLSAVTSADFTRIVVNAAGEHYASISSDAPGRGFYRSEDGLHWVNITPNGLAGSHDRTVIAIAPSDGDQVLFFSYTPGAGVNSSTLWHYQYLSGDGTGSGGQWTNRTSGLATTEYSLQGAYNMVLAFKPDDANAVFLGGNNLYRSKNGFTDTLQVTRIGGYSIDGDTIYNYFNGGGKHYPDQQNLAFHPNNPNTLLSTTDAGVHRANDCMLDTMQWVGLNNGYITCQFYGIAIDRGTAGSEVVIGGTQDRGTHWTNVADPEHLWTHVRGADGAYCDVEDGAGHYYISTQYANIERCKIASNGQKTQAEVIMPKQLGRGGAAGWLFVHPFTLDRANNDIMYLPYNNTVWRNTNITATDSTTLYSAWSQIVDVGSRITAIASAPSQPGVVYVGTNNGRLFRLDSAHSVVNAFPIPASDSIMNAGYTACIAVHPEDPMKAIAVFSNYNCRSIWYTEDGGADWTDIEGNLTGEPDPGVPENLWFISNGPSLRWAEFVPTAQGDVVVIGTSVGVFSTSSLAGNATEWVQQGAATVGNVVVDMLNYRVSDGWLVAGTHGNGMYAGHVNLVDTATPIIPEGIPERFNHSMTLYPNPASSVLQIALKSWHVGEVEFGVYDAMGRAVIGHRRKVLTSGMTLHLNVSGLPSGTYYLEMIQGDKRALEAFVKR